MGKAQHVGDLQGDIHGVDDASPHGVVNVVVDIGDLVGQPQEPALQGLGRVWPGVAQDAPPHLVGQVKAVAVLLQPVHHPQGLDVVLEALRHNLVEDPLAGVTEGGVPQVVAKGGGLRQVLVELEAPGHGPGNAGHLDGVGHASTVVIPLGLEKDLRLVHQPPKGLGVDDPVDVPLEAGPDRAGLHRALPSPGIHRPAGIGG